jgi:hypothetical protein
MNFHPSCFQGDINSLRRPCRTSTHVSYPWLDPRAFSSLGWQGKLSVIEALSDSHRWRTGRSTPAVPTLRALLKRLLVCVLHLFNSITLLLIITFVFVRFIYLVLPKMRSLSPDNGLLASAVFWIQQCNRATRRVKFLDLDCGLSWPYIVLNKRLATPIQSFSNATFLSTTV